jgi:hypothetical protein
MTSRFLRLAVASALMGASGCNEIGNTAQQVLTGPKPTEPVDQSAGPGNLSQVTRPGSGRARRR